MLDRLNAGYSHALMLASAVFCAVLGVAATFLPQEILASAGATPHTVSTLVVQIAGALYLGFAFLNWSTRTNLIGGIYGRPVILGNLMHYAVATFALLRAAGNRPVFWLIVLFYVAFGIGYTVLLFRHPGSGR